MIEIWGKDSCPNCNKAQMFCATRGLEYTYKKLDRDFTREEVMDKFPGEKVLPQVIINGKHVGSYDKMVTYIEQMIL